MEQLLILLKYYGDEIRVVLPTSYNEFTNSLCTMLVINKERINDFQFSYNNILDNKKYLINNDRDYFIFLNLVRQKNALELNVNLISDNQNQNVVINNNNNINNIKKMQKNEENEGNDLLNIPSKESSNEEKKNIDKNKIIKGNFNDIVNDMEPVDLSFSDDEKKDKENMEKNNKYQKKDDLDDILNDNDDNKENININAYQEQNKLINLIMQCNYCKNMQTQGEIYYCKDCSLFFCSNCEKKLGTSHPHCYYKIRNKEQFTEICYIHNAKNANNQNINNNNDNNKSKRKQISDYISEGSKIIGNKLNSVFSYLHLNNDVKNDNNLNNPYIDNNNNNYVNYPNKINNINNNYQYIQDNNNINNGNNEDIKSLVERAKSQDNLEQMNDEEIEKALIVCKGNIDKAVAILLSNYSK